MDEALHCARSAPHCIQVRVASIYKPHAPTGLAACKRNLQTPHLVHIRTKVIPPKAVHICAASQTVPLNSPLHQ